jgi:hypothetical protein
VPPDAASHRPVALICASILLVTAAVAHAKTDSMHFVFAPASAASSADATLVRPVDS